MSIWVEILMTGLTVLSEGLILSCYAEYLLIPKRTAGVRSVSYIIGFLLLLLLAVPFGNPLINGAAHALVAFALLKGLYRCSILPAILHSAVLTAYMCISEALTRLILTAYADDFTAFQTQVSVFAALWAISKLIYTVLCIMTARAFFSGRINGRRIKSALWLSLLPIASAFVAIITAFICMSVELSSELQIGTSVCLIILFFANIYGVWVYGNTERVSRDNLKMKLAQQKDRYDSEYYQMMQSQLDKQRILIHDVKNHMQIINYLASQGKTSEIEKYITQWGYDKALSAPSRYSSNEILNIIITKLAFDCEKADIKLFCDIHDSAVAFMEDTDISALLGNLLTNAYEAAAESAGRFIELNISIKPVQKTTIIRVTNSCDRQPVVENGVLASAKSGEYHGIGQMSIKRIVEKYGGAAEHYFDGEKHEFDWVIMLPNLKKEN